VWLSFRPREITMITILLAVALASAVPSSPARTLSGQVTDSSGVPLAQVRVTVLEAQRTTLTDLEGRYSFSNIPGGAHSVSFALVGYAPRVLRITLGEGDGTLDAILQPTLIELPEVQVTASPLATTSLSSPQPTSLLSEQELQANRAASLGETISAVPGVRSFSTGSGIGKPVIRGLSSNRVLVLADGQRVESQQWGDEHGPQVEAADAARIEVIRGPASVLYGSDALGGVVNVVTPPLPDALGRDPFTQVRLLGAYSTNNDQPDGTASIEGAAGGWGYRGSFTGRSSDDIHTPVGPLANSGGRTLNASGTVGYRGGFGNVSASYTRRDERVEIHEDPAEDPMATPFQRITADRVHVNAGVAAGASHFDVDLGYERNRRREFEEAGATEVALGLLGNTYSADIRLHHVPVGPFAGIVGVSGLRNTFSKFGEETLIPGNAYNNLGLYAFEQAELGRWNISLGARYDYRRLRVEDDAELGVVAQRREYNSATGNVGVLYRVAEPVALVLNVGRGYRAPTAFDLFANGVHEGTVRFERGDSTLRNETSVNTDLALRVQTRSLSAEVGGYINYLDDFIFPNPSGESDPASGFQIFDITQGNARLAGFEAAAEYHPVGLVHLRVTADYTNGQNTSTDTPLPFIPPFRVTYTARVEADPARFFRHSYISVGGESNSRQTRLDPDDFAPDGYTLLHIGAGTTLPVGRATFAVDVQVRNLFNERYASFLSRYKTYALDPGRNFVLQVSSAF
jgi:iron complex outermembrane receptor protein